ncbi:uncharacterized protein LOC144139470 [Haemaphysalis longicornis]
MLFNVLFVHVFIWLPTNQASDFDFTKIVTAFDVEVRGEYCFYRDQYFTSVMECKETCGQWTCYPQSKKVEMIECKPLGFGCSRECPEAPFPACCRETCPPKIYPCMMSDRTLLKDGESKSLQTPCEKYICNNGTLTTEKCPNAHLLKDPKCTASFAEEAPYPACCGVIACS